jgi:hypothetical protein
MKPRLPIAAAALLLWPLITAAPAAGLSLRIAAERVHVRGLQADRVVFDVADGYALRAFGLSAPVVGAVGELALECAAAGCARGSLAWRPPDAEPVRLDVRAASGALTMTGAGARVRVEYLQPQPRLDVAGLPLAWLARLQPGLLRPGAASGSLDAEIDSGGSRGSIAIRDAGFDTRDGRFAAAGVAAELSWRPRGTGPGWRVDAAWRAGEWLFDAAYLPAPASPLTLSGDWVPDGDGWRAGDVRVRAGEALEARGSASLDGDFRLRRLDLVDARADLAWAWRSGLESLAAAVGWGDLSLTGRLSGAMTMYDGRITSAQARLADVDVRDVRERIGFDDLELTLSMPDGPLELSARLAFDGARLYRVPLGASRVDLAAREDGSLVLQQPWRLPVLDGALVVEQLVWRDWREPARDLRLDARLEPVDLALLTRTLGWTQFGGRISGEFPGLRIASGVAEFAGGLDLRLFDGRARVQHLTLERPLGSLPALSADVGFDGLDLELLTRAFEFGHMSGRASGHVRRLRLLDWRPVRFDAWIETDVDSTDRRISQQAVDSLSEVSGGGSAISGALLQWFDEFPYRKAALGCRLSANVCTMRGLREADEGGYVILEGRGLPRLDIIGHQRRVDWPRLVAQLRAAGESG